MTLSFGLVYLWAYRSGEATPLPSFRILVWGIVGAVGIAVFTAFLLLTNFFHNPHAMFDAVATYFSYVHRSNGATPHDHPWWYYLRLLAFASGGPRIWWSEGVILFLACVGFLAAFFDGIGVGNRWYWRFIAVYTVVLVVIYSAIPYKTPWCMLTFLNGMILLAGAGFGAIQRFFRYRILQYMVVVLFAACLVQLGQQAYRAAYRFCADPRNPYVYAHTSTNFMKLVQRIEQIAAVDPAGHDLFIQVITPDAWPLPWYLRGYSHVGYWAQPPDGPIQAPMVIVSAEMAADVEKRLAGDYLSDMYGLRPEVLITLHIRKDLWNVFLKSKSVMEQNIFLSHFCFYAQRG